MMTNKVADMIQNRIIYDNTIIRNALVYTLVAGLAAIILLLMGLNKVFKRYCITPKKQHYVRCLSILLILLCAAIQLFGAERNRFKRLYQLRQDSKEQSVQTSLGVVENIYPFEKGGNAATINGQKYFIMPGIGNMNTGMEFQFDYLETSKFIVSFQVKRDTPIPPEANVSETMLWRFGNGQFEAIKDIYQVDDLAYQYVRNYYKTLGREKYESFLHTSWKIYSYHIKEGDRYRSNFESDRKKICIVMDALSGRPIYLWTEL